MILETLITATVLCSNSNWQHSERCLSPVKELHQTHNGFYGTLESGVEWKQIWITPELMLFSMENVKYLINGKGTIVYLD